MHRQRRVVAMAGCASVAVLAATACSSGSDGGESESSIAAMASQLATSSNDDGTWLGATYFNVDRYVEATGIDVEPGASTRDLVNELGVDVVGYWPVGPPFDEMVARLQLDGVEPIPLGDVTAMYADLGDRRSLIIGDFDAAEVEERLTSAGGSVADKAEWTVVDFAQSEDGERIAGFGDEGELEFSDGIALASVTPEGGGVDNLLVDDEDESLLGNDAAADVADALDGVDAHSAGIFASGGDLAADDAVLAAPWEFGGVASAVVDDESRAYVVLAHASDDDAAANADPLGVWGGEWLRCEGDVDVETDGAVTVASCASDQPFVIRTMMRRDYDRLTWPES